MPNEEAARAAHAALIQTVRELRGEPDYMPPPLSLFSLGLDPWDELPPIEQQFYTYVAAAVRAADPDYAALVRAVCYAISVEHEGHDQYGDRASSWVECDYEPCEHVREMLGPHLLDAARGAGEGE